jgi:hypothetical protein
MADHPCHTVRADTFRRALFASATRPDPVAATPATYQDARARHDRWRAAREG